MFQENVDNSWSEVFEFIEEMGSSATVEVLVLVGALTVFR